MNIEKTYSGYRVTYKFSAKRTFGLDGIIKGYTFWVRLYISKDTDNFNSFTYYENIITEYIDHYRHMYLNDMPEFSGKPVTLENMCFIFYNELKHLFKDIPEYTLEQVEIGDNPLSAVSMGENVIVSSSGQFYSSDVLKKYLKESNINVEDDTEEKITYKPTHSKDYYKKTNPNLKYTEEELAAAELYTVDELRGVGTYTQEEIDAVGIYTPQEIYKIFF